MVAGADLHDFSSLFRYLVPDGPYVSPKPWESVLSESGVTARSTVSTRPGPFPCSAYDPSTISEANLVRLVLNALQGVKSAVDTIEKLSALFCSCPSDRTFHRIPNVWHRSSSTNALGKFLKSISQTGARVYFLRKFVDYILYQNSAKGGEPKGGATGSRPQRSVVNQAFAVAVSKILEEYMRALNTLHTSVKLRRSFKNVDGLTEESLRKGCLTSVINSDISMLEVYLHTKELRTHIESLVNICLFGNPNFTSSKENLALEINFEFHNVPTGADLLTYLYLQLRDSDPVHRSLLEFLFVKSFEPYCGFIKSWIYKASIDDPYGEFVIEYMEDSPPNLHLNKEKNNDYQSIFVKERRVVVPCFLEDVCKPLLRAGQQLHVLIKLLDMCSWDVISNLDHERGTHSYASLSKLEEVLPYWHDSMSSNGTWSSPLLFSRKSMDVMSQEREKIYIVMQKKLENFLSRMNFRGLQMGSSVIWHSTIHKSSVLDEDLEFPPSFFNKETNKFGSEANVIDASSMSDGFSSEIEELQSSECSSLNNFEDQSDLEGSVDFHVSVTASELLQNLVVSQGQKAVENELGETCKGRYSDLEIHLLGDQQECSTSEILVADEQSGYCFPFGECSAENLFTLDESVGDQDFIGESAYVIDEDLTSENMYISKGKCSHFFKLLGNENSTFKLWNFDGGSEKFIQWLKGSQSSCHLLSVNPMLTKKGVCLKSGLIGKGFTDYNQSLFPYYDFTSVQNPWKTDNFILNSCWEFQADSHDHSVDDVETLLPEQGKMGGDAILSSVLQTQIGVNRDIIGSNPRSGLQSVSGNPFVEGVGAHLKEQHKIGCDIPVKGCDESVSMSRSVGKDWCLNNISDGSRWGTFLQYSDRDVQRIDMTQIFPPSDGFEIPLDIVIDRCIVQDILLQYNYISSFSVKLLEKGFDLQGHLSALKRFHFMELADWADSFILTLWRQRLHVSEAIQQISEIQGLLDSALQRSSCERDCYKGRLFVYTKGEDKKLVSSSSFGICAFNLIALGYRVDWPVCIILTPSALKVYAKIFSFLTQVKLAAFSLTDVWCMLKDLKYQDSRPNEQEMKYFNILIKVRQQINHFVSTLQQYVQSQLSYVSWSRFLQSLKHEVKDMLDLDSLHMSYLADSLHICFLSTETQPVADVIQSILQCALDFESCLSGSNLAAKSYGECSLRSLSLVNISQVFVVKGIFEKNLRDLYICYLKTSKHREFGLHHFWGYLNYNDYYSNDIAFS